VRGQPAPGDPDLVSNPGDPESVIPPLGFSISGHVTGAVSAAVTITLSGSAADTTVTDASGYYIFTGLSDGNYTVMPSKTGYRFRPKKREVTLSSTDVSGVDFVAKVKRWQNAEKKGN